MYKTEEVFLKDAIDKIKDLIMDLAYYKESREYDYAMHDLDSAVEQLKKRSKEIKGE